MSEQSLAELYLWITRQFPYSQEPEEENEAHFIGPLESVVHLREALLIRLREAGTLAAYNCIIRIVDELADEEGMSWLRYTALNARQIVLRKSWNGHEPKIIMSLAESNEKRLVENGKQLLDVIVASFSRLQDRLQNIATPAVDDLWNENHTPKNENHLSNYVKRYLEDDLQRRGIIANREVEVRTGQRTDIHVQAIATESMYTVTVIVETKGCWNRELKKAMKAQLRERYLKPNGLSHGLYLVGWYLCDPWNGASDYRKSQTPKWSLDKAKQFFMQQAEEISEGQFDIRAFVLDTQIAAH